MFFRLLIEVAVAMFAAFGVYCALHAMAELLFPTHQIAVAVEIATPEDAENLDALLYDAKRMFRRRGGMRTVVLLSADLMDGRVGRGEELFDEYDELLDRYGAECYLIDMD